LLFGEQQGSKNCVTGDEEYESREMVKNRIGNIKRKK
jgi:hypothetical protein